MTVYTPSTLEDSPAPLITRIYNLRVWDELDRVQISEARYHTLTITGFSGAPARTHLYSIDGRPATMTDAYYLMRKAQTTGSVEMVNA